MSSTINEKKVVLEEILREYEQLKLEYEAMQGQAEEQIGFITSLTSKNEKKDEIIQVLEQEVERLASQKNAEIELVKEEGATKSMEKDHQINILQIEISRLRDETKIIKHLESENAKLRDALNEMSQIKEKLRRIEKPYYDNTIKENEILQNFEEYRKKMQSQFESEVAENKEKLKLELELESREAVEENERMKKMINSDNKSLKVIIDRFKVLQSSIPPPTPTNPNSSNPQTSAIGNLESAQEVDKLKDKIMKQREELHLLQENLHTQKMERANFELLYTELEQLSRDLKKMSEKYNHKKTEAEIWKGRAMKIKNLEENFTPENLRNLLIEKEKIIRHETKSQKKKDLWFNPKIPKNADQKRMEIQAKLEEKTRRDFEMLSIWNANYDYKNQNTNEITMNEETLNEYNIAGNDIANFQNESNNNILNENENTMNLNLNLNEMNKNENENEKVDYVNELVKGILLEDNTSFESKVNQVKSLHKKRIQHNPDQQTKVGRTTEEERLEKDNYLSVLSRNNVNRTQKIRPLWQPIHKPTSPHRMLPSELSLYSNTNSNNNNNNNNNNNMDETSSSRSSGMGVPQTSSNLNSGRKPTTKKGATSRFLSP